MNPGKIFEEEIKSSMPKDAYCLKLADPANGFASSQQAAATRFAVRPPYDFVICKDGKMYAIEAKSVSNKSLSYGTSSSARIKVRQVEALLAVENAGGTAGLLINFREFGETYFVKASEFKKVMEASSRKSFSLQNAKDVGILIPQKLKKVRYSYDLSSIFA